MPGLASDDRVKLIVFAGSVVAALTVILAANVTVHDRSMSLLEGAGTPLRAGLERLAANPQTCAMTM